MEGYEASTYGERIADVYDDWYSDAGFLDTAAAVDTLAELAGAGPALELAIGTGRIALPLSEHGVEVHGIDASEAMVAKLREKPGAERIAITIGDFADVGVEGTYPLVYLVFNTLFALDSQDDQVRCFENVAHHLVDGGLFAIDAFVPDPARFRAGGVYVHRIELDQVQIDVTRVDANNQRSESQHIVVGPEGVRLYPVSLRWAYPTELDLMARLAGLRLKERWASWRREPFTAESTHHVSIYQK